MSDVKATFGIDASAALEAAKNLPDQIERNMRKDSVEGPTLRPVRVPGTTQYEYLSDTQIAVRKWRERQEKDEQSAQKERLAAEKKTSEQSRGTLGKWVDDFKDNISGKMVASFSAASLAVKAFGVALDLAKGIVSYFYDTYRMSTSYGFSLNNRLGSTNLALSSLLKPEEVQNASMAIQRSMINAVRLRDAGGLLAMSQLGIKESDFRAGKVDPNEILTRLAGKYKQMQGGMQFDMLMKNLGVTNWEDLIPLLQQDETKLRDLISASAISKNQMVGMSAAAAGYGITSIPEEQKKMPLLGPGAPMPQLLNNVTSLQAMGGGDILSAIARGPQERTADAAEGIEKNTAEMSSFLRGDSYVGKFNVPAKLGR